MVEKNDEAVLYGMKAICRVMGGASEATVIKIKREYPKLPIRKLGGVWVGNREELGEWFRRYCLGTNDDGAREDATPRTRRKHAAARKTAKKPPAMIRSTTSPSP